MPCDGGVAGEDCNRGRVRQEPDPGGGGNPNAGNRAGGAGDGEHVEEVVEAGEGACGGNEGAVNPAAAAEGGCSGARGCC